MNLVEKARHYAADCHARVNHTYDNKPYEVHLKAVYQCALDFIRYVPVDYQETVLAACWAHDVIEDCRQTYNDVKEVLGEEVAELVYALTNEKGKNRKERANDKYYEDMKKVPFATFVKVCDRIANYEYSLTSKSGMAKVYEEEQLEFSKRVKNDDCVEVLDYLNFMTHNG